MAACSPKRHPPHSSINFMGKNAKMVAACGYVPPTTTGADPGFPVGGRGSPTGALFGENL